MESSGGWVDYSEAGYTLWLRQKERRESSWHSNRTSRIPSRARVSAKGRTVCSLRRIMYVFRQQSFNAQLWSDVYWVKFRPKVEEHSIIGCSSLSSSLTSVSFPIELLPAPPPVLRRPFCLGLELYSRLYPLGHLLRTQSGLNNHRPPWTHTCPVSSVPPPRLLLSPRRYRRHIAHRTWWAFPRAYPGIGRGGRGV